MITINIEQPGLNAKVSDTVRDFRNTLNTDCFRNQTKEQYEKILLLKEQVQEWSTDPVQFYNELPEYNEYAVQLKEIINDFLVDCKTVKDSISVITKVSKMVNSYCQRIVNQYGIYFGTEYIIKVLDRLLSLRQGIEEFCSNISKAEFYEDSKRYRTSAISFSYDTVKLTAGLCHVFDERLSGNDREIADILISLFCTEKGYHRVFPVTLSTRGTSGSFEWNKNHIKWGRTPYGEARWNFVKELRDYIVEKAESKNV